METNIEERWATHPTVKHLEVSTMGRVIDRRTGKLARLGRAGQNKYLTVSIGNASRYVHRLVLETFIGPCPDGHEGCHNNGNKYDNRLCNLRWDTHKNNIKDAVKAGAWSRNPIDFGLRQRVLDAINEAERIADACPYVKVWTPGIAACLGISKNCLHVHMRAAGLLTPRENRRKRIGKL